MSIQSYGLVGIGAGLIGVLIGSSGGPDIEQIGMQMSDRLGAVEARLDGVADLKGDLGAMAQELAAMKEQLASPDESAAVLAALKSDTAGVAGQIGGLGSDIAAGMQALSDTIDKQGLALSSLSERVDAMGSDIAKGAMAAPEEVVAAVAPATAETSAPAAAPKGDAIAQALLDKIGETGLVMGVGETRELGGAKLFLSRMDGIAGEAHFRVIGGSPVSLGPFSGPVSVGDSCGLEAAGFHDGKVYLATTCN